MTPSTLRRTADRVRAVWYWVMVIGVAAVMGVDASGQAPAAAAATSSGSSPSWGSHLDVVQAIIVVLFGFGVWSVRSKVMPIDAKFDLIFRWKDTISEQLQRLQGEHNMMKGSCHTPHRRQDDTSDQ